MTVIAKLFKSNVLSTNPADVVGAFVGQECRGIAHPDPSQNGMVFLTISSNIQSGETVTFKAWKSAECEECPIAETIQFINMSEVGTISNPFKFNCGLTELCVDFGAGYTWFSVNVYPGSMTLGTLFSNITPCENDRVIGQQSFAVYYGTGWVGSLTAIDPNAMYKMKLCSAQQWCKQGLPVPPAPLNIPAGYSWIGYLPQTDLSINTALGNIVPAPVSNDRFNGQSSFAVYSGTWIGSLDTLQKGKGYIIRLTNPSVLSYPAGSGSSAKISGDLTGSLPFKNGSMKSNPHYNMQLIGNIILPDGRRSLNPGDEVYAYVGSECRGMAKPVPELNGRLFLSIGSDIKSGESVTFKVYLSDVDRFYEINNNFVFTSEMETGTMDSPYQFKVAEINKNIVGRDAGPFHAGEIYPNPLDANASLEITLDKTYDVDCKIINGLGQVVQVVMNKRLNSGTHLLNINGNGLAPGFYNLMIGYGSDLNRSVISKRMIIK
jgi:hypothetical protein